MFLCEGFLVAASGGHSSSRCVGLSLSRALLLRSTGSRHAGSAIVAHGPSRSAACGIFPDQGSNPCALHWQADSQLLHHQGSPTVLYFFDVFILSWFLKYVFTGFRTLSELFFFFQYFKMLFVFWFALFSVRLSFLSLFLCI